MNFPRKNFFKRLLITLVILALIILSAVFLISIKKVAMAQNQILENATTTIPEETATSTFENTTSSSPTDGIISTSTSENFADSAIPEESSVSTSTEESALQALPALPEEPVEKQSLLATLFGAVWDLLFGEDNLSQTAEIEDKVIAEIISGDVRLTAVVRNSKAELWVEDTIKKEWQKIADEEMISENSPIGFQDNIILWLSPDQKAMVGLDTLSQVYFSQSIEPWGNTIIEFNDQKYILLLQNNTIALAPSADEINEISF